MFQMLVESRDTSPLLLESVVMAPVSCEAVAVKVVVPDDRVLSSTPLLLVMDDPFTAILATTPCTLNASAAEFTVALLIASVLGPGGGGRSKNGRARNGSKRKPKLPAPVVVTLPPLIVSVPPLLSQPPGAAVPEVWVVVFVAVIVPALATNPAAPAPLVAIRVPSSVAVPPFALARRPKGSQSRDRAPGD